MTAAVLYACYYNVGEPLVRTQVIAYLRELAARGFEIHLMTFEKDAIAAPDAERIADDLARQGIRWHPRTYHRRSSLIVKAFDIAVGAASALRLARRHRVRLVHGRSHAGAAMVLPVKWLCGARLLFDVRGLLADEYVDGGNWARGSLKYRVTKRAERFLFRQADGLVMLTRVIRNELVANEPALRGRDGAVEVIPCCVGDGLFDPDPARRDATRKARGWSGRRVVLYVGKLGTWYLVDEMARFFAVAHRRDPSFFFQVLTQSDPEPLRRALVAAGVPPEAYDLGFAPPDELPQILEAGDAGLSFIRSAYSKRSSSPTKVGEYLAAGLPVVSTPGIGDCDEVLSEGRGVILSGLTDDAFVAASSALTTLLNDPATAERCRSYAARELSMGRVGGPRYAALYQRMLAAEGR